MNNKITIYELLGLVKDGQAPKRIKFKDNIYEYKKTENGTGYVRPLNLNGLEWLANRVDIDDSEILNSEVEILDNEDEDIEEIDFKTAGTQKEKNRIMKDKINKLVREVNKLKKIDCFKSKGE